MAGILSVWAAIFLITGSVGGTAQTGVTPFDPSQIVTGLYALKVENIPSKLDQGSGGAIDAVGDDLFLTTRLGEFFLLIEDLFIPLSLPSPVDLEAQAKHKQATRIGLQDLQIVPLSDGRLRFYVSVTDAEPENGSCILVRAAYLDITQDAVLSDHSEAIWTFIFESNRCADGFSHEAGGAITISDSGSVLLTVGTFSLDGTIGRGDAGEPQDPGSHYGKTLEIDPNSGSVEIFSSGHRNADGLVTAPDGTIWQIEHGPRGGDELNIIERGKDYGWPRVSYGTNYGRFTLRTADDQGRHDQFERPIFSWVPSIGVSALELYGGPEFPQWDGDLLISSLGGARLDRVHVREGRAIVVERIPVGKRIRDIAVTEAGQIFIKLDNVAAVLRMTNASADGQTNIAGLAFCASCHNIDEEGSTNSAAPSLVGVLGRDIASVPGFAYSEALQAIDGTWDEDSIKQFISAPDRFAPGTLKPKLALKTWEIDQAIRRLREP
ncbi:MAG: PQQ-dependent sugar dehydrogenase [Pseudomonadota bacterium]